jgi:mannose-6-phosphate isomerase-like protein (cupin superfamily)
MQTSATAAKLKSQDKPKAQMFSLKTPYMKQGRVTQLVAETANLWIHTKINAEGGENEIHKHIDEDHAFIVLEGQMSVFDELGNEMEIKQHQGVMIPKGAYYRYLNTARRKTAIFRPSNPASSSPNPPVNSIRSALRFKRAKSRFCRAAFFSGLVFFPLSNELNGLNGLNILNETIALHLPHFLWL